MDAFLRRAPGQSLPPAVATRKSSDVWDHAKVHSKDGSNHKINCVYCGRKDWVVTATRFQQHLGHIKGKGVTVCSNVPEDVKALFAAKPAEAPKERQVTLGSIVQPAIRDAADQVVADFFYYNGIAFNVASSHVYRSMVAAIARAGPGYIAPTDWRLRNGSGFCATGQASAQRVRLLAQSPSASPCERNWSAYDFVHSKKRNRLGVQKAQQLVYVFQNMRTVVKYASAEKADEYYLWAMHTKVEPSAEELSDSDESETDSSDDDEEEL